MRGLTAYVFAEMFLCACIVVPAFTFAGGVTEAEPESVVQAQQQPIQDIDSAPMAKEKTGPTSTARMPIEEPESRPRKNLPSMTKARQIPVQDPGALSVRRPSDAITADARAPVEEEGARRRQATAEISVEKGDQGPVQDPGTVPVEHRLPVNTSEPQKEPGEPQMHGVSSEPSLGSQQPKTAGVGPVSRTEKSEEVVASPRRPLEVPGSAVRQGQVSVLPSALKPLEDPETLRGGSSKGETVVKSGHQPVEEPVPPPRR